MPATGLRIGSTVVRLGILPRALVVTAIGVFVASIPGRAQSEASAGASAVQPPDPATLERALRLLDEVPLVDGHNDLPWQIREKASGDGTVPTDFTSPSITSAGVIITPNSTMRLMSSIFSTVAGMPSSAIACSALCCNWAHFLHPVPRTCTVVITNLLVSRD